MLHKGGLGSASLVLDGGITVGALVAANPMGSVTTPSGRHFWAAPFEIDAEFGALGPDPQPGFTLPASRKVSSMSQLGNTTIAIVATDAKLDKAQCHRMATAAHDGMARAIVPSHSPMDGDLVFAAATGEKEVDDQGLMLATLGHAASICLARAIARAVWEATPAPGDLLPTLRSELA
jgi:D-aminopeptidase